MRHERSGKKLSRPTNERVALYRSLAAAIFLHDRITTTEAKAKAVRS
jgi:large subunit ribosomal protein L17